MKPSDKLRSFGCPLVAVVWLLPGVLLLSPKAFGATSASGKRVLILHSFGRDFAPFNAVSSAFRTELARQSAAPIEFLEASLETARFTESRSETPFVDYLRVLFGDRPPALLVSFGAPAMNFLHRHRERLFPVYEPEQSFHPGVGGYPDRGGSRGPLGVAVDSDGPLEEGSDGVVKYLSAHIDGVESEKIVRSGHSTQGHPETIQEVKRILIEHAKTLP